MVMHLFERPEPGPKLYAAILKILIGELKLYDHFQPIKTVKFQLKVNWGWKYFDWIGSWFRALKFLKESWKESKNKNKDTAPRDSSPPPPPWSFLRDEVSAF